MNSRKTIFAIPALVFTASFNCAAAETYTVSASLLHNGKQFGAPTLVVEPNTPASMEVTGPSGYKLSLTVSELASDKIKVAATLDSSFGKMAPVVVVHPGQPATVALGELEFGLTVQRTGS